MSHKKREESDVICDDMDAATDVDGEDGCDVDDDDEDDWDGNVHLV